MRTRTWTLTLDPTSDDATTVTGLSTEQTRRALHALMSGQTRELADALADAGGRKQLAA